MINRSKINRQDISIEKPEEINDDISDVRFSDIPAIIIFIALFMIVALQFFTRYVLNDSLGWTEEIARYFLILLGFVGGIGCVRKGKHIFLEFAYNYLPIQSIKPIIVTTEAIISLFWSYAGWLAIELAERTNSNMVSINIPKAYLYYIVAASCFLMALNAIVILVEKIKKSSAQTVHEKLKRMGKGN